MAPEPVKRAPERVYRLREGAESKCYWRLLGPFKALASIRLVLCPQAPLRIRGELTALFGSFPCRKQGI